MINTTEQITRAGHLAQSLMSHSTSPLAKLLTVAELIDQAETLKAQLVANAREDGASWQTIANHIGGTKQAAQQRYATAPATAKPKPATWCSCEDVAVPAGVAGVMDAAGAMHRTNGERCDDADQLRMETASEVDELVAAVPLARLQETHPGRNYPIRVAVIPCSGAKLDHAAPARELYTGSLFRAALSTAEAMQAGGHVDRVLILSARHGLVELDEELAPYDVKMGASGSVGFWELRDQLIQKNIGYVEALTTKAYTYPLMDAVHLANAADAHTGCTIDAALIQCPSIHAIRHELKVLRDGWSA